MSGERTAQAPARLAQDPFTAAAELWESHGWAAGQQMSAAMSVIRAQQIIVSRLNSVLKEGDLTFARFEVLVLLHFTRDGVLPLGKIGARLSVHPTSITATVERLVRDRLVTRTPSTTDRRTILARITQKGHDTVEEFAPRVAAIDLGLSELGEADSRKITGLLIPLRRSAGDFA